MSTYIMGSRKDQSASTDDDPMGQVETDPQGNRVWKWATDTLGSTSRILARLTENDLALAETGANEAPDEAPDEGDPTLFDPYNSSESDVQEQ